MPMAGIKPAPLEVIALHRLAFGPRPGQVVALKSRGFKAWVEQQLEPDKLDDSALEARIAKLATLRKPLEQLWKDHNTSIPEGDPDKYTKQQQPTEETRRATFLRMAYSTRQLYEVLVDFWHNHFNVNPGREGLIGPPFAAYDRDVIRQHALGNFRQFLEAVATHPAMLYYLDNAYSSRGGPNENYARELFELHTLGAENYLGVKRQREVPGFDRGQPVGYVDDDVYEASRAFTGWRVDDTPDEPGFSNSGKFMYLASWHDRFQKTVLGRYLPPDQAPMKDGRDVLDALAAHPGTARFISRKLARRLVGDNPPEALVGAAARVFVQNRQAPDQLKQVVREIVFSEAFERTWGEKIKRPLETMISYIRALNSDLNDPGDLLGWLWGMGQPMFGRIPPDGYPDKRESWTGTGTMLERWRVALGIAYNWPKGIKTDLRGQTPGELRSPEQLASFWLERLGAREVSKADVIQLLARGSKPKEPLEEGVIAERLPAMVAFILMAPEFQLR